MIISCGEALIDCFKLDQQNAFETIIGGSPLNVAIALAKAGSQAGLMTNISTDQFGQMIMNHIEQHQVSTRLITRSEHLTGLMFVQYNTDKSANYHFYGHNSAEINYQSNTLDITKLSDVDCLHFGSFSLVCGDTANSFATIIEQQKRQRVISVDINIRTAIEPNLDIWNTTFKSLMKQVHILKASTEDLCLLYQLPVFKKENALPILKEWRDSGVKLAIITDAQNGAYALHNNELLHVAAIPACVVDTVGAGDCFMAFLLNSLKEQKLLSIEELPTMNKEQLLDAMHSAIKAAAYTVSHKGAVFPSSCDLAK